MQFAIAFLICIFHLLSVIFCRAAAIVRFSMTSYVLCRYSASQCLIRLPDGIAGPRDVEALKIFVLNEAEKAGEAGLQDEL
jgi:hypothetical protein